MKSMLKTRAFLRAVGQAAGLPGPLAESRLRNWCRSDKIAPAGKDESGDLLWREDQVEQAVQLLAASGQRAAAATTA
jgi:hypothetical protein